MTYTDDGSMSLSPEEAFAVLGNETRFAIVHTLWDLYEPDDPANVVKFAELYDSDAAVPFSELYDRVGYDDTGNFNYHLEKLTDHFVRRTDAGYELTEAGFEVVRAIVAGTVRDCPTVDPTEIDASCPRCDAPVAIDYGNHHVAVSCSRCPGLWQNADGDDGVLFTFPFPPTGLADRTPQEVFHATLAYNLNRVRSFVAGICPDCSGSVDTSLDLCRAHEPRDGGGCPVCHRRHLIEVAAVCQQCKAVSRGPLAIAVLAHPAVTAFYHDHGIDYRFASWATFQRGLTVVEEVIESAPLCVALTAPCEDEELRLILDGDLHVVETSRHQRR
ncbi:helix-turn-helix domain-containing protein [Halobacteria archaeon AArc-dxtr1]|nr:helix-turn-helix domain-containing protein [Halobacteria archaeon AArc-dxtr1]